MEVYRLQSEQQLMEPFVWIKMDIYVMRHGLVLWLALLIVATIMCTT